MIKLIFASRADGLIGDNSKKFGLPWHIPEDLEFFKSTIKGQDIIVGHKTYKMLPLKILKLVRRVFVVTTDVDLIANSTVDTTYISMESFEFLADDMWGTYYCIGGKSLIDIILKKDLAVTIDHTNVISFEGQDSYNTISPDHVILETSKIWDTYGTTDLVYFEGFNIERVIERSHNDSPNQFLISHYVRQRPSYERS